MLDSECQEAIEALLAAAEWPALRQLSKQARQGRVAKSKLCHSVAFVNALLIELRSADTADEAELVASLAVQAANLIGEAKHGALREDLKAQAWIEIGNLRRRDAEWRRAEAVLSRAERHLVKGSGDPFVEARLLSVKASLRADQGHRAEAVAILLRCRKLYAGIGEWSLVARTLVKEANVLVESEPEKALAALSQALPLIREEEILQYAELLRAECFVETRRLPAALQVFLRWEPRWTESPQDRIRLRSRFLAGKLLEGLGRHRDAVRLLEELIAGDLHYGLYKDAFLDLLYLFGLYIRSGDSEGAIAVCKRSLDQMQKLDLVHEQLHVVWARLTEAATMKALDDRALIEAREYLRVFWRHPAPEVPKLTIMPVG
jgi:tetratricopeptide (TPR) repeat protein